VVHEQPAKQATTLNILITKLGRMREPRCCCPEARDRVYPAYGKKEEKKGKTTNLQNVLMKCMP